MRNKFGVAQYLVDNTASPVTDYDWVPGRSPGLVQAVLPPVENPEDINQQNARYFPMFLNDGDQTL